MASIDELCWKSTEELFRDVDLETLFVRQLAVIGSNKRIGYPFMLLIHTGKITMGITLQSKSGHVEDRSRLLINDGGLGGDQFLIENF